MSSDTPPDKNSVTPSDKDKKNDSDSDKLTKNLDNVKKLTEQLTILVEWLAKLVVTKNWVSLLLVIDAFLLIGFFPQRGVITGFFKDLPIFTAKEYAPIFWLLVAGVFLTALVIAIKTMPRASTPIPDFTERKAIKGLRAFSQDDAEIFAQLQRDRDLRECLESIKSDRFRLGILMGESGCGKTSFLQAGIIPQLTKPESNHRGVYIRFDNRDPLKTIDKALVDDLNLPEAPDKNSTFLQLLASAVETVDKPLVLILDQFEQFFVHFKQKSDREPFIAALKSWYSAADPLPVKILISIRGDLADRLIELQKALGYSLSPQEVFRLEKFSPEEATKILQVIAKAEKIEFDESFVRQLTENELASREDGLISPVDLQVLAWTIEGQKTKELKVFNRNAFQKIGGIEGLMTRFLNKTLDARVTSMQRQAAVKVLLAMTDLDRNVRAGVLTVEDLQTKLQGKTTSSEIVEATTWLASGGVRLISSVQRDGIVGYELAHERLIPALREVIGKELTTAERANQLLDRRVNEWLGNYHSPRYLFNWQELKLIQQQKPYLVWGTNKRHKERLLKRSWKRLHSQLMALAMVLVFFIAGMGWWYSPWGQIHQVRWDLAGLSKRVSYEYRQKAAVAFIKDESFEQALAIADSIKDSYYKAEALSALARTYSQRENNSQAVKLLEQALTSAQQIDDSSEKAKALTAIAQTISQLESNPQAVKLLELALTSAQQLDSSYYKAEALTAIAQTYSQREKNLQAVKLLKQALASVQQLDSSTYKVWALRAIAQTISQLENNPQAVKLLELALTSAQQLDSSPDKADALIAIAQTYIKLENNPEAVKLLKLALDSASDKAWALRAIAQTISQLENNSQAVKLLELALASAQQITDSSGKVWALTAIAQTYIKLENNPEAVKLLELALASAQQLDSSPDKADALIAIAQTYSQLENNSQAVKLLELALASAQQITDSSGKVWALIAIAQTYSQLENNSQAVKLLELALASAQQITDSSMKVWALTAIAQTISQLENNPQAVKLLELALASAQQLDDSFRKVHVLSTIVQTQAKLYLWRQANRTVSKCPTDECKVEFLAHILTAWAEKKNPAVE